MLVNVVLMNMMQMTVMKIIHMTIMPDRGMPAIRSMLVKMTVMMFRHG
jgi:hypothetical protein